ncbi:MAG: ATP-binding protein [Candidatus Absconditabacterales bacterium]
MFQEEIIKNQNRIAQEIKVIPRNMVFDQEILKLNKVISFVGPRRAGKTYYMYQVIHQLIDAGLLSIQQVVFIDFSEFINLELDTKQLLEDYTTLYPDLQPFFVFDEAQEIKNFRTSILKLFNDGYKIFLSGSNSKILSSELTTHLRGRDYQYFIYPLSFGEFLRFKKIQLPQHSTATDRGKIKSVFIEYMEYGAYPEIAIIDDKLIKQNVIKNYFDILLYKDLIERYGIGNEYVIKYLIQKILQGYTKETSINKIHNELKSKNIEIGKNTLYNYFEYLENIFFIFRLKNYYSPNGQQKAYLGDTSFANILGKEFNKGQSFENMVYLQLKRTYGDDVYYLKNGHEIDFYIPSQDLALQVCYEMDDTNQKREIQPLLKSKHKNNKLIVFENDNNKLDTIDYMDWIDFFVG